MLESKVWHVCSPHHCPRLLAGLWSCGLSHVTAQSCLVKLLPACRTLFVGNVPDEVTDIDLADYFCNVGEVLSAQIRGNDGGHYAFLEFACPDDVHRVLSLAQDQPFEMCDQPLRVQPRRPKDQHQVSTFPCTFIRRQSLMKVILVVCPLQAFLNR